MELEVWIKENEWDVCVINKPGLNGNVYVEVSDEYKWIGTTRDWMRGKTGGVDFVKKSDMECQRILYELWRHKMRGKCIENEVCIRGD